MVGGFLLLLPTLSLPPSPLPPPPSLPPPILKVVQSVEPSHLKTFKSECYIALRPFAFSSAARAMTNLLTDAIIPVVHAC
jgi:hypothetical protein